MSGISGSGGVVKDRVTALFLVVMIGVAYWLTPVSGVRDVDTLYALLSSHRLMHHGEMDLGDYFPGKTQGADGLLREDWRLERVRGRLFFYFPPGPQVMAVPFVRVAEWFGWRIVDEGGRYSWLTEQRLQVVIAAVFVAAALGWLFLAMRCWLPWGWSVGLTLAAAFGTPLWSSVSRDMSGMCGTAPWLGFVIWQLCKLESVKGYLGRPVLLGTALSWMFFCRPTNAVAILGVSLFILLFHRRMFVGMALTGGSWLIAFLIWSQATYGKWLPSYYGGGRLGTPVFWEALAGNIISPSRGVLVALPVLVVVVWMGVRYWRELRSRRLAALLLVMVLADWVIHSLFTPWNGGGAYGPRYMSGTILAVTVFFAMSVEAWLKSWTAAAGWAAWGGRGVAWVLFAVGLGIHARGSLVRDGRAWCADFDRDPTKTWDWGRMQYLNGLVHPREPDVWPVVEEGRAVSFGEEGAGKAFCWFGWSLPEAEGCWNDGTRAGVVFGLEKVRPLVLRIHGRAYRYDGGPRTQRVCASVNGHELETRHVGEDGWFEWSIPVEWLRERNILDMRFPDGKIPWHYEESGDARQLALFVRAMEWTDAR